MADKTILTPLFTPVFADAIQGQRPSASQQNKITSSLKQLLGTSAPYSRMPGPELIRVTDYDPTRKLYSGTVLCNMNHVHVHNAVAGSPSFSLTSPAEDKSEIYDFFKVLVFPAVSDTLFLDTMAFYHAQSGYYIPIGPAYTRSKAVVTETGGISANSSGEVTFYKNDIATARTETAYYNWLYDADLAEGQRVIVQYYPDEGSGAGRWSVELPWC